MTNKPCTLTIMSDRMSLTDSEGRLIARAVRASYQRGMWHIRLTGICWIDAPLFPVSPVTGQRDHSFRKCWRKSEAQTQLTALAWQIAGVKKTNIKRLRG